MNRNGRLVQWSAYGKFDASHTCVPSTCSTQIAKGHDEYLPTQKYVFDRGRIGLLADLKMQYVLGEVSWIEDKIQYVVWT